MSFANIFAQYAVSWKYKFAHLNNSVPYLFQILEQMSMLEQTVYIKLKLIHHQIF